MGCGDGSLLHELITKKEVTGLGLEVSMGKIKSCLEYGISVIQEDLNEGLKDFQDNAFDYVILSQTLEYVSKPLYLIKEMLRVGKKCIISFENIAYWKSRFSFLFKGTFRKKKKKESFFGKRKQIVTVNKFLKFCDYYNIEICENYFLPSKKLGLSRTFPNLFSKIAILILKGIIDEQ